MRFIETQIEGCYQIRFERHRDSRGTFVKTFQKSEFLKRELPAVFTEDFHSLSRKGVLRGLHFQLPPYHHDKVVYSIFGRVFDAVLDLRKGSPTFGKYEVFELSEEEGSALFIPAGLAHGFYSLSDLSILGYKTNREHSSSHDHGVHWSSAGIEWPDGTPVVSKRDSELPLLENFESPFIYDNS